MPRPSSEILKFAKLGAEARLRELVQEAKNLFDLFPHLRDAFDSDELPVRFIIAKGAGRGTKADAADGAKRLRRRMSATARQAVSARMKRYWAQRRKAKKTTAR
jgi:hypothetical protein